MKLTERIRIEASVSLVWEKIAKPSLWPGWIAKIQSIESLEKGHYRVELMRKSVIGQIETLDTYKRMRFVSLLEDRPDDAPFIVQYDLQEKDRHVIVTETLELEVPFPFSWLAKLLHRFGKRQKASNLEVLKELCE